MIYPKPYFIYLRGTISQASLNPKPCVRGISLKVSRASTRVTPGSRTLYPRRQVISKNEYKIANSLNRRTPIQTPKYYNPYYREPNTPKL